MSWRQWGRVLVCRILAEDFSVLYRRCDKRLRIERGVVHLLH